MWLDEVFWFTHSLNDALFKSYCIMTWDVPSSTTTKVLHWHSSFSGNMTSRMFKSEVGSSWDRHVDSRTYSFPSHQQRKCISPTSILSHAGNIHIKSFPYRNISFSPSLLLCKTEFFQKKMTVTQLDERLSICYQMYSTNWLPILCSYVGDNQP